MMEQSFSFRFDQEGHQEVIYLVGTIDAKAEAGFEAIQQRISGLAVMLDFSRVGRINSMGIAMILRCLKQLGQEREAVVQLRGLNQMNAMLFKMSGVFLLAKEVR